MQRYCKTYCRVVVENGAVKHKEYVEITEDIAIRAELTYVEGLGVPRSELLERINSWNTTSAGYAARQLPVYLYYIPTEG